MDAKIFQSSEVCMYGSELRRLRMKADISEQELAEKMGWYRKKIQRYENQIFFCLHPADMQQLLKILD